jgi:hypothetical protein
MASYIMSTRSIPAVKCLGHSVIQTSPSNVKVKESVELYIYSPSVPFIASYRVNITHLILTFCFVLPDCYWHTNVSHKLSNSRSDSLKPDIGFHMYKSIIWPNCHTWRINNLVDHLGQTWTFCILTDTFITCKLNLFHDIKLTQIHRDTDVPLWSTTVPSILSLPSLFSTCSTFLMTTNGFNILSC